MRLHKKIILLVSTTWMMIAAILGYLIWDYVHAKDLKNPESGLQIQQVQELIQNYVTPVFNQYDQQFKEIEENNGHIVDAIKNLDGAIHDKASVWTLSQIQQYIGQAIIEAELLHNPEKALQFLDLADKQIERLNNPAYLPLRQAIAKDKQMIVAGLSIKRENVIMALNAVVDTMPKIPQRTAILAPVQPAVEPAQQPKTWKEHLTDSLAELKSLVVVRHHIDGIEPYFSPNEATVVNENMQLILLQASYAVTKGNQALFDNNMKMAITWFNRYYDIHAPLGEKMLVTLNHIKDQKIASPPMVQFETPIVWNQVFKGASS